MEPGTLALQVRELSFRYGARRALDRVTFQMAAGSVLALLGPNGSGKSTLFRILSTLVPPQEGQAHVFRWNLRDEVHAVRSHLGVVFQSPALDKELTVRENLSFQGALYGLSGQQLQQRIKHLLGRFGVADREADLVKTLSGGLRRRVELAKGLLHRPQLLILDEPSTGLDPNARRDLWHLLDELRRDDGVSIFLTTHLLDEADRADQVVILDQGRLVADGPPRALRAEIAGQVVEVESAAPHVLAAEIRQRFDVPVQATARSVRLDTADPHAWVARLLSAYSDQIDSIHISRPSLEDVFVAKTGYHFADRE